MELVRRLRPEKSTRGSPHCAVLERPIAGIIVGKPDHAVPSNVPFADWASEQLEQLQRQRAAGC